MKALGRTSPNFSEHLFLCLSVPQSPRCKDSLIWNPAVGWIGICFAFAGRLMMLAYVIGRVPSVSGQLRVWAATSTGRYFELRLTNYRR